MPAPNNPDLKLSHYVIACVDILGQGQRLKAFPPFLNPSDGNYQSLLEVVRESFGVVDAFRNHFRKFFEIYTTVTPPDTLQGARREELLSFARCDIKTQTVSDTIIISFAFDPTINKIPIVGVRAILTACAAVFIEFLAAKHPLRGGIEVGIAGETPDGGIYGPALNDAHALERNIAQYPRIVVGNKLHVFLEQMKEATAAEFEYATHMSGVVAEVSREYASFCMELISRDHDGQMIVDYVGNGIRRMLPGSASTVIRSANQFLVEEAQRFKNENNAALSERYDRAVRYFGSRLELWQDS